ncbi:MAG: arsenosugar biosynthesis radical SAM protein ArsS [Candidatus Abyssubacteria bacterium]
MNEFDRAVEECCGGPLHGFDLNTLQVNVGFRCNQQCLHCHVSASPHRAEIMSWAVMSAILDAVDCIGCEMVDLTGGAPELNPHFRRFVEALCGRGLAVQVRTNLTVLLEPGMTDLPEWLGERRVQLVASLPCYLEENVCAQRGTGVYHKSIEAIRRLNAVGYARTPDLPLSLVYNPGGPFLPPEQSALEADYRRELGSRFGIIFTRLLTITNMPMGRFGAELRRQGREAEYLRLLRDSFNPGTLQGLMCRHQVSVGWDGTLYDCDFNLALGYAVNHGAPDHIDRFEVSSIERRRIVTGEHCFGCSAGHGSSCSGALA